MSVMTTAIGLPQGRPLTADDLERMPDDGHRYELIDGTLIVTPAPGWGHQAVQLELAELLRRHRPKGVRVLTAAFAVRLAMDTEVQPDILVARYEDLTRKNLPAPPLLAVEIRSPSTALVDNHLKRATYARFGILSYWLVDPDPDQPSLTVLELRGAEYVEIAHATGAGAYDAERPYPVTVVPAELVRELRPD